MPPKFQSSFIPKGPIASAPGSVMPPITRVRRVDFFSFVCKLVFGLSILLALGVVGYKWYLGYSIEKMGAELERARAEISEGVVGELVDLNDRILSTQTLIENHRVLSPLFSFLESSTPKAVRFVEFDFLTGETGPEIVLRGQAASYAALASEADAIYKNTDLKNPVFSDIRLDERGNVTFSLKALVAPEYLSYQKTLNRLPPPVTTVVPAATTTAPAATSSATVTPRTGTTTAPRN